MGYVLVEVPEGVHLIATTVIYQSEWKNNTKKNLKMLIAMKTDITKENLLYALRTRKKQGV